MKQNHLILSLLLLIIFYAPGSNASTPAQGSTIKAPDGLYEFTLHGNWKEIKNPGPKIDKMFVTADAAGRFFILRVPNPPDSQIGEEQLSAYIEGLGERYKNYKTLQKKVLKKGAQSIGVVAFTYETNTPKGPLSIRSYCEVMIHKKNYLNVCGMAPTVQWEKKKEEIFRVFQSWKLL